VPVNALKQFQQCLKIHRIDVGGKTCLLLTLTVCFERE